MKDAFKQRRKLTKLLLVSLINASPSDKASTVSTMAKIAWGSFVSAAC